MESLKYHLEMFLEKFLEKSMEQFFEKAWLGGGTTKEIAVEMPKECTGEIPNYNPGRTHKANPEEIPIEFSK